MGTRAITMNRKLDIIPSDGGGIIIVPGCETTSDGTSPTLLRNLRCCSAFVQLKDALEAIPGSYVEYQHNNGTGINARRFVLPSNNLACGCGDTDDECCENPDWFKILKDLACETAPEPPIVDCGPVNMGYCPMPDFQSVPNKPTSTYFNEGEYPPGVMAAGMFSR